MINNARIIHYALCITHFAFLLFLLSSCVEPKEPESRYYGDSYNFIVTADSMQLLRYLPSEASLFQDTLYVYEDERVAISDILTSDSLQIENDTTWVQLMRDAETFGWVEEMAMREQVVPADPISQAIAKFSDSHYLLFGIFVTLIVALHVLRRKYKRAIPMVVFRDIPSAYPATLCLLMAAAATLYSTIQMFDFEGWQYYYYHPTINPMAEQGIVAWFLALVWVIVIMAVACISEVSKHLKTLDTCVYLLGLFAHCCVNYVIFSQLTLCFVGYPLLILYTWVVVKWRRKM